MEPRPVCPSKCAAKGNRLVNARMSQAMLMLDYAVSSVKVK